MAAVISRCASLLGLPDSVVVAGLLVTGVLAVGSILRAISLRNATAERRRERLGSLAVWWVMLVVVTLTVIAGPWGGAITFGVISILALREYFRLLDKRNPHTAGRWFVLLAVPVTYAIGAVSPDTSYTTLVMVVVVMGITLRLVVAGLTTGFIDTVSQLSWGYLVLVYFPAHAALLLARLDSNPVGRGAGWLLYLIAFTEADDIFQALWGRRFGRRKITPVVSPHKTWEGFLLGGLTAIGFGLLLAPWLTPLATPWEVRLGAAVLQLPFAGALVAGILMLVAGFFGDLNISAVKRDVRVKDCGDWLPGQGGILDRIDSLTFTAPVFYYFVYSFYG